MGAGFAANQRVIGSQDPEEAARLAGMDPKALNERMKREHQHAEDVESKRGDLLVAATTRNPDTFAGGLWVPKGVPRVPDVQDINGWQELLAAQPPQIIEEWFNDYQEQVDEQISEEEEGAIRASLEATMRIQPDDPLYDPLTDHVRKKAISEGLKPLSFEDMIFHGSASQEVPVRDSFVLTFRTIQTTHGGWLEWYASNKFGDGSVQYFRHQFGLLQVAASLDKINGKSIGPDLTRYDSFEQRDEFITALEERMRYVGRLPSQITDDLIVQYTWFSGRVRRMMTGNLLEKVGNS